MIDSAVDAVGQADTTLATLQDSLLPVEVGDPEVRAALAELRELIGGLAEPSARARANDRALLAVGGDAYLCTERILVVDRVEGVLRALLRRLDLAVPG